MALPPLPESNTKRYWMVYQVKGVEHQCQIRVADDFSDADALDQVQALAVACAPLWPSDCSANGILVAEKGSDVRNPVAGFTPVVGEHSGSTADINIPFETTFTGRARSGRRWTIGIFGLVYSLTQTWRIQPLTSTGLDTIRAVFVDGEGAFLAIDGSKPVYNQWANFGYNDHWVGVERNS
jgi:hypothetical protein